MSHRKPHATYTPRELAEADYADLMVDLRCAIRDGLFDYAQQLRLKVDAKRAELLQHAVEDGDPTFTTSDGYQLRCVRGVGWTDGDLIFPGDIISGPLDLDHEPVQGDPTC